MQTEVPPLTFSPIQMYKGPFRVLFNVSLNKIFYYHPSGLGVQVHKIRIVLEIPISWDAIYKTKNSARWGLKITDSRWS